MFPDHIACLEDGQSYKTLRRHLQIVHGTTPEQYRERWGLPASYPMTVPNYAERRSDLARSIGLGRRRPNAAAETEGPAQDMATTPKIAPKRRGRKTAAKASE